MAKLKVDNLFRHADGGYYCLLNADAAMKDDETGDWIDAVFYTGVDGKMRATSKDARWYTRFEPVAELDTDDEEIISMVRRCNPGSTDFDFMSVFESWHESEMGITGQMLELAVAAAVVSFTWSNRPAGMKEIVPDQADPRKVDAVKLRLTTEDLQHVSQNYEIERVPVENGYSFIVSKSFPNEG